MSSLLLPPVPAFSCIARRVHRSRCWLIFCRIAEAWVFLCAVDMHRRRSMHAVLRWFSPYAVQTSPSPQQLVEVEILSRQVTLTPSFFHWKWPHQKTNRFIIRRCHPYARNPASQAILVWLQSTSCATRLTPHGVFAFGAISTVCLVGANPTCSAPAL